VGLQSGKRLAISAGRELQPAYRAEALERAGGLGSRFERWLALESHVAERPLALTAEQVQFLEKLNPQWKERHVESSRPGELLCQDNFFVGHLDGVGKVYLQAVVDAYSSYAFGLLATSKQPETAALLLHNEVLPSYAARDIDIGV
jgi:transposase InsO family protein